MQWGMKGQDGAERGETPLAVFDVLRLPSNKTVHIFRTQTMPEISVTGPTRSYILQALKCTSSGLVLPQGGKETLGKCRCPLLTWPTQGSITNLWVNTGLRRTLLPPRVFFLCVFVWAHAHDKRLRTEQCYPTNVGLNKKTQIFNSALAGRASLLVLTGSILFLHPSQDLCPSHRNNTLSAMSYASSLYLQPLHTVRACSFSPQ